WACSTMIVIVSPGWAPVTPSLMPSLRKSSELISVGSMDRACLAAAGSFLSSDPGLAGPVDSDDWPSDCSSSEAPESSVSSSVSGALPSGVSALSSSSAFAPSSDFASLSDEPSSSALASSSDAPPSSDLAASLVSSLGVVARGLLRRSCVEAPGSLLVAVGLRRTRSPRFRRLLGFALRGLRRVCLGRSLRRRLGIRRGLGRSLRRRLRGISIVGRRGGRLTVVIAGRIVDFGVVGDDLEGHLRGVGLGLEVGEVERVLPDGDLGVLGHGEVVRAGHLTLLIDRELLLRRVFGAIGADNGDSGLLVRGESGSGEADSLLLVRDV